MSDNDSPTRRTMNTYCTIGGLLYKNGKHVMEESMGERRPVLPAIKAGNGGFPDKATPRYFKIMRCRLCGDGGLFDQDDNAIEYYQPTTLKTKW